LSFKDIFAQDIAVKTLQKGISSGVLSGAYLFVGPGGVGKRFTAKQLAKALNCQKSHEDACDQCLSCQKIERGSHPDLFWLEAQEKNSQFSIEVIRELKREITLKPWEGTRRLALIVEVERATIEAQNAFLKILEETPSTSLIVLTSQKTENILPTVLSRCKMVHFGPIPSEIIQQRLRQKEDLSQEVSVTIARLSHGSLGKALQYQKEFSEKEELLNHFLDRAFHVDEERSLFKEKGEVQEALDFLTSWYRDLWLFKEGSSKELFFHQNRLERLEKEASEWTASALEETLSEFLKAREMLDQHVNTKILLSLLSRRVKALKLAR